MAIRRRDWIFLAGIALALAVYVFWSQRSTRLSEERERAREALKEAIGPYWTRVHATWPIPDNLPEQAYIRGKLLPLHVDEAYGSLESWVYPRLDEAIRPSTIEEAKSLAIIESDIRMYSGGMTFGITTRAVVTIIDLELGAAVSRREFVGTPPPGEMSLDAIQKYDQEFWRPLNAYLNQLPRK